MNAYRRMASSPVTSWALCGLLLTASKPLIYLFFLKSNNYPPTKTASFLPENWRLLTLCAYRTHRAKCSTAIVKPPVRCFYYTPHWRFTQNMGWSLKFALCKLEAQAGMEQAHFLPVSSGFMFGYCDRRR